eukprot:s177_g7.t1
MAVLHCPCGLAACSSCWKGLLQQQLARCKEDFKLSPLGWSLLTVLTPSLTEGFQEQRALLKTQKHELKRLFPYAVPRDLRAGPPPACVVCGEDAMVLLRPPGCPNDHAACQTCWARWGEEQIEASRHGRRYPARCLWPGCESNLHVEDWLWRLLKFSPRLSQLVAELDRRVRLQQNRLYPPAVQVDCPRPGCVGLGYLGFDTVMCFICEHQWDATEGILGEETELPEGEEVAEASVAGVKVKRCPKCNEYIEKNGGCDHMTCRCRNPKPLTKRKLHVRHSTSTLMHSLLPWPAAEAIKRFSKRTLMCRTRTPGGIARQALEDAEQRHVLRGFEVAMKPAKIFQIRLNQCYTASTRMVLFTLRWLLITVCSTALGSQNGTSCQAGSATSLIQKASQVSAQSAPSEEHPTPIPASSETQPAPITERESHAALLARAFHRAGSGSADAVQGLDSAVSSKVFDAVGDGFDAVGNGIADAAGSAADVAGDISSGIADVGLAVGDYVGNAAVIVGNSIVEAAETSIDALPNEIKDGETGYQSPWASEVVADATVDLAGDALDAAEHSVAQGVKLASTVGNEIASKASALGGEIAKLGPLAAGLAKAAWDEIKKFINCLAQSFTLCKMLIGDMCDCDAGSDVSASLSGLSMRCKFKHTGDFAQGFGISSSGSSSFQMGDASSGGKIKLPGSLFQQPRKHSGSSLRSRKALKGSKSKAPAGSCESSLELAVEAGPTMCVVQFEPTLSISLKTNRDTEVGVEGLVRASFDALATAEGGCGFPQKPLQKVACAPPFCVIVLLQMVAEVEMSGVITGSAEVGASADFQISGSVVINPNGHADADFQNPTIKHQEGFGLAASAFGSVRVGMGPVLTVWPMPGVPIVINPMFNAEVRAQGTLRLSSGFSLAETQAVKSRRAVTSNTSRVHRIDMCGAAAVNLYADIDIQGFALPKPISASLGTGILKGATALVSYITGPAACIPGAGAVTNFVMDAAHAAAGASKGSEFRALGGAITGLIPNLNLDFSTPSMQLMGPTKLYCKEVFTSPGFDTAACPSMTPEAPATKELGCKFAGRPPPPMVTILPAAQVAEHVHTTSSASACYDLPMGDRFIQLGHWRLAAIDDNHFSISHKDTRFVDFGAWGRSIGAAKGISFGFQYIQIGKFRMGAVDENHLSIAHIGGQTAQIFRNDGTLHPGPTTHWSTYDRPEPRFFRGGCFGV